MQKREGIMDNNAKNKQLDAALKETEFLLSESQRLAHIGSWSWDITAEQLFWTPEMYNICGVSPATFVLTEQSFLGLIHPDHRTAMERWIKACIAGEKPQDLEFSIILPDGSTRFISGRGDLQYDSNNKPFRLVGTAQDITERRRAEEELHLLHIMTKEVSESEDFHEAMNIVVRKFCEVAGSVYGEAWVPSPDKSYFEIDAAWYSTIKGLEEFRKKSVDIKFYMDKGIPGRVWASKKPLWVRDISMDTNFDALVKSPKCRKSPL